ncbi:MAG: TlpA family protein disulfide reductase [Halobacteriaceae archaeon]
MRGTRREFLVGLVGAAAGLAGCSGDSGGEATATETATTAMATTTTEMGETVETADSTATATTTERMSAPDPTTTTAANSTGPAWLTAELTDVTTGKTFTVAGLAEQKPVLLETFAVWCPVCTNQQSAIQRFRQEHPDIAFPVSLNVDPNEDRQKVRDHVNQNGFDWRYAVAPPQVSASLQASFGSSMLNPPSAPMAVVCSASAAAASRLGSSGYGSIKGVDTMLAAVEGC